MEPERWHRVTSIFHAALGHESSARATYVDQACGSDASLRAQVEEMLAADADVPKGGDPLAPSTFPHGYVLGPYVIDTLIGKGGMGEVYQARDTRLNRKVAIKVLPAAVRHDPIIAQRFASEAQAIASVNHPNICVLHDVGTDGATTFLVMEYLDGETLERRLESGALRPEQAIGIGVDIAEALARAHRAGVVHRDLKPSNVMLTKHGAKVLDFGLAKVRSPSEAGSLTGAGQILGTMPYMAPEQIEGRGADERSDVFALGAVLYEMLTGQRAFSGSTVATVTASVLRDDPPQLVEARYPALGSVVRACLAKDPDGRLQSAHDLALQLRWVLAAPVPSIPPPLRSRRWWSRAAAAAALLLIGAAAALAWRTTAFVPAATPAFRQMTFRRGVIKAARFSPDGQAIVFSASWDGRPDQLFLMRIDTAEAVPLPVSSRSVPDLSISSSGELAIVTGDGTLERVPLGGSGMRDLLSDVRSADWAPNGVDLAVLRDDGQRRWIEYPIGKTVLTTTANIGGVRVSPDGDIAVVEIDSAGGGWIDIIDRSGRLTRVSSHWSSVSSRIAWGPSGRELWFAASEVGLNEGLHAVARDGRERVLQRTMGSTSVLDVRPDGRALVTHEIRRGGITAQVGGDERDLSWLDFSRPAALSSDGKTLLFTESGAGGGPKPVLFVRGTDGSPAVRLIEGEGVALSPDGAWVAARSADGKTLTLMPMGPGQARTVPIGQLTVYRFGAWLPNGRGLVLNGSLPGRPSRAFLQPLDGGTAQPITPEGVLPSVPVVVSPDSRFLVTRARGAAMKYPIDGGDPVPFDGVLPGELPLRWSNDGTVMWLHDGALDRPHIIRLDVRTRQRRTWKEVSFGVRGGLLPGWFRPMISDDGNTFIYGYVRVLQDLYLADHLQ